MRPLAPLMGAVNGKAARPLQIRQRRMSGGG